MRSGVVAALALGVAASTMTSAEPAGAAEYTTARATYQHCQCTADWPHRQYWQWDRRPIWDDPWLVLTPNFFGSAEPHLVPADIWARKWHPPWPHHWRPRHARLDP